MSSPCPRNLAVWSGLGDPTWGSIVKLWVIFGNTQEGATTEEIRVCFGQMELEVAQVGSVPRKLNEEGECLNGLGGKGS